MSSLSSIALSGLRAAQTGLQAHAHNIANGQTPGFTRQQAVASALPQGGVATQLQPVSAPGEDLAADTVGLVQARHAFGANLAVLKTSDRLLGTLLDLHA